MALDRSEPGVPSWFRPTFTIATISICAAFSLAYGLISVNHTNLIDHDEKPAHDAAAVHIDSMNKAVASLSKSMTKQADDMREIKTDVAVIRATIENAALLRRTGE